MTKIKLFFKKIFDAISDKCAQFSNFLKVSNLNTRASMVLMGLGQLMYKQIGKGLLYLFIEILFILFFKV